MPGTEPGLNRTLLMPLERDGSAVDEPPLPPGADCTMMLPVAGAIPPDIAGDVAAVKDRLREAGVLVDGGPPSPGGRPLAALGSLRNGDSFTMTSSESLGDTGMRATMVAAESGRLGRPVRARGAVRGQVGATSTDVDEARRIRAGAGQGGDPPIFREVVDPTLTLDEGEPTSPWDGLGPDLSGVLRRLAAVRVVLPEPAGLVAGLAGDVAALVAEVRVRRAAGPSGRAVELVPHLWQGSTERGGSCHRTGCWLPEDAHPRELPPVEVEPAMCDGLPVGGEGQAGCGLATPHHAHPLGEEPLTQPCDGTCGSEDPHDSHLLPGAAERLGQAADPECGDRTHDHSTSSCLGPASDVPGPVDEDGQVGSDG